MKDGLYQMCKQCKRIVDHRFYLNHHHQSIIRQRDYYNKNLKKTVSNIQDPIVIYEAFVLRQRNLSVQEISKILSSKYHKKITQIGLCNLFDSATEPTSLPCDIQDYEYPSREDIENTFSTLLQKEKNMICQYGGESLRRSMMIKFLNSYWNKEFSYNEARITLNDRDNVNNFFQHFKYLENNNFIETVSNDKFKFCDRVKSWKTFWEGVRSET